MKRGSHRSSLSNDDRVGPFGSQYFDVGSHLRNFGRADEDHFKRRFGEMAFKVVQEFAFANRAVNLTSVRIPADPDIECAEAGLRWVLDFRSEQNGSSTSSERGLSHDKLLQPFEAIGT